MELDKVLKIRLSSAQLATWQQAAVRERIPLSAMIRAALLGRAIHRVPELNQHAWIQLSHVASNLNQLASRLNSAARVGDEMLFLAARDNISQLDETLCHFRAALLGASLGEDAQA